MSPHLVDLWAASAAGLAGSAIAIRARMLRPRHTAWIHAPTAVWVAMTLTALGLLMAACTIALGGGHATAREAMVYSLLAACSVVMLWNLNRSGRLEAARRQRFAQEARMAIEAGGPPARYPGERA